MSLLEGDDRHMTFNLSRPISQLTVANRGKQPRWPARDYLMVLGARMNLNQDDRLRSPLDSAKEINATIRQVVGIKSKGTDHMGNLPVSRSLKNALTKNWKEIAVTSVDQMICRIVKTGSRYCCQQCEQEVSISLISNSKNRHSDTRHAIPPGSQTI